MSDTPDFSAAKQAREQRVIDAILNFDWGDYRLNEVDELAQEVKAELEEDGESDHMDWARDLAKAVLEAARPLNPGEVSG